jgi:hypothetical protein
VSDLNHDHDSAAYHHHHHHLKSVFQGQLGIKYAGFQQYALGVAASVTKVGLGPLILE